MSYCRCASISGFFFRKTPRFGSVRSAERLGTMSPAARRLATNKLGIRIGTDKALKASYTPSPGRIAKTPTRTPKLVRTATEKKTASAADIAVTSSITDNLLDLSSSAKPRPSAADFF
jgi:protein DGCR14